MNKKVIAALVIFAAGWLMLGGRHEDKTTIMVTGAWALYPMMVRWGSEYEKATPGVTVEITAGGAGKGMADTLNNLTDIGMLSRDIYPSEAARGAYGVAVAKDAVVVTANRDNPVRDALLKSGLKRDQFRKIFLSDSPPKWGDLVGQPDADKKVSAFIRSDSCGASDILAKYLGAKAEDLRGVGVNGDPGIAEAVSNDRYGAGYNNLNFAYDQKTGQPVGKLVIIPIDQDGNGRIDENESFYATKKGVAEAIADGRYPSPPARDLYLVTNGRPSGETAKLIAWILTEGQKYVPPEGYVPLSDDRLKAQAKDVGG